MDKFSRNGGHLWKYLRYGIDTTLWNNVGTVFYDKQQKNENIFKHLTNFISIKNRQWISRWTSEKICKKTKIKQ